MSFAITPLACCFLCLAPVTWMGWFTTSYALLGALAISRVGPEVIDVVCDYLWLVLLEHPPVVQSLSKLSAVPYCFFIVISGSSYSHSDNVLSLIPTARQSLILS